MSTDREWLSLDEAAASLHIKRSSLQSLISTGRVVSRLNRYNVRIVSRSAIDDYLRRRVRRGGREGQYQDQPDYWQPVN